MVDYQSQAKARLRPEPYAAPPSFSSLAKNRRCCCARGTATSLSTTVGGAWAGAYVGFHLVGVPTGPHCGLAVLPAVFLGGCLGAFAGMVGLALGQGLAIGLIERFWLSEQLHEEDF
jgi:hypothetical protein